MSQFRAFACGVIAALALTALVNSPQLPAASPDHGVDARLASIERLLHAALGDKADLVAPVPAAPIAAASTARPCAAGANASASTAPGFFARQTLDRDGRMAFTRRNMGFKHEDKFDPEIVLERIVAMAAKGPSRWYVQVGAHLGDVPPAHDDPAVMNQSFSNDPTQLLLRAAGWSGLLVEPVPHLHARLAASLAASGRPLRAANVAICPPKADGTHAPQARREHVTFYSIASHIDPRTGRSSKMINAKTGLGQMFPPWITQVGSLDRQHIMTYQRWFDDRGFNISDFIEEVDVRCLSVAELLADADVAPGQVRVLVVDTEGFDGKIIRGIDFTAMGLRPSFIMYEHANMHHAERHSTLIHLWEHGYSCWRWDGGNTWCLPLMGAL